MHSFAVLSLCLNLLYFLKSRTSNKKNRLGLDFFIKKGSGCFSAVGLTPLNQVVVVSNSPGFGLFSSFSLINGTSFIQVPQESETLLIFLRKHSCLRSLTQNKFNGKNIKNKTSRLNFQKQVYWPGEEVKVRNDV